MFQLYNIMIQYLYTRQNYHHNKSSIFHHTQLQNFSCDENFKDPS